MLSNCITFSMRKKQSFHNVTTGCPVKWHLRNEHRNCMPMYVELPTSGLYFCLYMPQRKFTSTNQKHFPDLRNDASSEWNFCTHSPGLASQWYTMYQCWSCEMSAVFSGYIAFCQLPDQCTLDHIWCQNIERPNNWPTSWGQGCSLVLLLHN